MKKMALVFMVILTAQFSHAAFFDDPQFSPEVSHLINDYMDHNCLYYHDTPAKLQKAVYVRQSVDVQPDVTSSYIDFTLTYDAGEGPFDLYQMIQIVDRQGQYSIGSTFGACRGYVPY